MVGISDTIIVVCLNCLYRVLWATGRRGEESRADGLTGRRLCFFILGIEEVTVLNLDEFVCIQRFQSFLLFLSQSTRGILQ